MTSSSLPFHPTLRYPAQHSLAGDAVQAIFRDSRGRVHWPIFGAAPDDGDGGDGGGGDGGSGGSGSGSGSGAGAGGDGDLGFPPNTPVAEMTPEQKAAYGRHKDAERRAATQAWKQVTGERTPEQLKADLEELQTLRDSKKTESDRAIEEAEKRGRESATTQSLNTAAKAILRANLSAQGYTDESDDGDEGELTELTDSIDVKRFIVNGDIDVDKLSTFAKKFSPTTQVDNGNHQQRQRDWAGGQRREGDKPRGAGGKAEAARRWPKQSSESDR